ncbi:MAG: sel1 repeat family protein [Anaerofustis stercorihominis]|nr:sel1 repeat family protein [Anaerofustis stercorihominis]
MDLNKLFELARGGDLTAMEELAQRFFWGVDVEENDDQAFYWFVNAARKGSAIGYNGLGNCYRIGAGVEANAVKAFENYEKAAELDFPEGQYNLANCYLTGVGVEKDTDKGMELLIKAADGGIAEAAVSAGMNLIYGELIEQDTQKGIEYLQGAMQAQIPAAFAALGECYRDGLGVEEDLDTAIDLFEMAAELHYPDAISELIYIHDSDLSNIRPDDKKAFFWCKFGADMTGDPQFNSMLALYLYEGRGCEQDKQEAIRRMAYVASMGDETSYIILAQWSADTEDYEGCAFWMEQAAKSMYWQGSEFLTENNPLTQTTYHYYKAIGDDASAARWNRGF